jgi:hypothetical protein
VLSLDESNYNKYTISFSILSVYTVAETAVGFGEGFYKSLYVDDEFAFVAAVAVFGVEFAEVVIVDTADVFGVVVGGDRAVRFVDAFGCGLEDGIFVLIFGLFSAMRGNCLRLFSL